MHITNATIASRDLLRGMYDDGYFPDFLVEKIKTILLEMCARIEVEKPQSDAAVLGITHAAVVKINELEKEFEEHDSELETVAREIMAEEFEFIVKAYGFNELDIEDVIEPRDW